MDRERAELSRDTAVDVRRLERERKSWRCGPSIGERFTQIVVEDVAVPWIISLRQQRTKPLNVAF